jgi:hypothetical protein
MDAADGICSAADQEPHAFKLQHRYTLVAAESETGDGFENRTIPGIAAPGQYAHATEDLL